MPDAPAHDRAALEALAREALLEITPARTVGALRDIGVADDVATVRFSTTQGGYLGWAWTVSIAVNPGMEPSVLETELMPGDGALLAPDWVPWADRLEEYLAQQAEAGDEASEDDDQDDDEHDDDHPEHDDDVDGVDVDLHADDESSDDELDGDDVDVEEDDELVDDEDDEDDGFDDDGFDDDESDDDEDDDEAADARDGDDDSGL